MGEGSAVRRLLAVAALLAGSALADEVVLKDGRRIRGEVEDKGDTIEVRHKFGVLRFAKAEVERIVPEKDLPPEAVQAPAATVFANPVLRYRVKLPEGDWTFVRSPPFPLTDLVVHATRDDAMLVIRVDRPADPVVPSPELAGAEALERTWRAELEIDHADPAAFEVAYEPFGDRPAYRMSLTAQGRITGARYQLTRRYLVDREVVFVVDGRRPVDAAPATAQGLARAEASFEFYEPKERDGDLYSPIGQCFQVELDRTWWVTEAKEAERARYRLAGPGDAYLEILVEEADEANLDATRATALLTEYLGSSAERDPTETANEKGLVTYRLDWKAGARRGHAWCFLRDRRLYRVRAEGPKTGPGLGQARALYERLEILRDYSVDLDDERKAFAEILEGKRLYNAGKLERSAVEFAQALQHWPRDSTSHNYLGLIAAAGERWEEAVSHFRAARALYPASIPVNLNYGQTLIRAGREALEAKPPDYVKARVWFEECESLCRRLPQLAPEAATGLELIGLAALQEKRWASAERDLARALELDEKPEYRHNLALVHYEQGVEAALKGNLSKARSEFRQALEVKPDFAEARQAYEQVGGR